MTQELRLFNTLSGRSRDARSAGAPPEVTLLRLRAHRLQPRARRQLPVVRGHRRAAPHAAPLRLPRPRGHERDRRGRPDHPEGAGSGDRPRGPSPPVHPGLRGGHGDAAHRAAGAHAAGDRPHPGDDRRSSSVSRRADTPTPPTAASTSASPPSRSTAGSPGSTWPGSRPGRASTPTSTTRRTRATSSCGSSRATSPSGRSGRRPSGRAGPGWHIECSAMSMKYLGETFDLHAGGEDLVFPHHENEIAQSTCGTGKPFARHWMHVKHLLIDNETMSKSKGNFLTIPDLVEKGHSPEAIRYLLAGSHYRKPLNFGFEGLAQAKAALERLHGLVVRLDEVGGEGDRRGRPPRPAPRRGARSTRRWPTISTRPRPWPRSTASWAARTRLLAEGALTRAGAVPRARAELAAMDGVFGVLLPGGRGGPPRRPRSRRSSTSGRRRGGGGSSRARTTGRGRPWRRSASCSRTPRRARAGGASGEPGRAGPSRGPTAATSGEDLACEHLRRPRASGSWPGTTAAAPARSTSWPTTGARSSSSR